MKAVIEFPVDPKDPAHIAVSTLWWNAQDFRRWFLGSSICRFIEHQRISYWTGRSALGRKWGVFLTCTEEQYYLVKLKLPVPSCIRVLED